MTEDLMIHAIVRLKVSAENQEAAISSIRSILEPTRVQPGCLGFRLYQEVGKAGRLALVEQWGTREDFERHVRSNEYRTVLETIERGVEPPEIQICEVRSAQGIEAIQEILGAE